MHLPPTLPSAGPPENIPSSNTAGQDHWDSISSTWGQTGCPLRPGPEDQRIFAEMIRRWVELHGPPRVLFLGVTPELYRLPWPEGSRFLAVDKAPGMIRHVWPGAREEALQADWLDLPLPPGSRDLVLCDGGFNLLAYPHAHRQLLHRLHEVLPPQGRCLLRLFALPRERETPAAVWTDLLSGGMADLNALKLRLAMALQDSPEAGIDLDTIWRKLRAMAPDWETLAGRLGWPLRHLQAIDAYRGSEARFHFLTVNQVRDLFAEDEKFVYLEQRTGTYPLAERCPVVAFERV